MEILNRIIASVTTICPDNTANRCDTGIPQVSATSTTVSHVFQIVFGIVAAITVLIIVINGLRIVMSQGDSESVKKGREAIIAAVIGLVIALSAEVVVTFVLTRIKL